MLILTHRLGCIKITLEALSTNYTNLQIIRWRKPRWIPIAKSKIFRVPPRCKIPVEEDMELMRLNNNYRTQIKSIRKYLCQKYSTTLLQSADPEEQIKLFTEDWVRCMNINDQWNSKQKLIREERVAKELEVNLEFARNRIKLELIKQEKKREVVEEIVRKQKDESKNFILPDNIDAAIEHSLTNHVDYNFAIDLDANKIVAQDGTVKESGS